MALPRLAVLFVLSAASSPCPDLNLIHYISDDLSSTGIFNFSKSQRNKKPARIIGQVFLWLN